jgi:hypothetical protein
MVKNCKEIIFKLIFLLSESRLIVICFSQALMSWVKIDVASRKKDVSRLLSLVKLPLLTPSVRSCLRHLHSVDALLMVHVKDKVISVHTMKGYGE